MTRRRSIDSSMRWRMRAMPRQRMRLRPAHSRDEPADLSACRAAGACMSNDFRSDGVRAEDVHIEVVGDGPSLLLRHGWAMHGGVFAPLLPRLTPHFRVHLADLPGHGRSRDSTLPLALEAVVDALVARVPRARGGGGSLGGL